MAKTYKTGLIITGDASGGVRAIRATDDQLGKLNRGFDRGSKRSKRFNRDVTDTSQGLKVLRRAAAPIAGMIAGMFAANSLQSQIDYADQLQKTNLRIGASTEALSEYNYVAKLSGVTLKTLSTAWQRQTRRIAEAANETGPAVDALEQLGLSAQNLKSLSPEDQFEAIAAAMQGVASESERVALAQKIWDSEGVKLVQIVNQGTDAIAAMRAEANALGLTISQETANNMATYNDEVDRLKFAAQGVSQTLLADLVPALTDGLQSTSALIQELGGAEVVLDRVYDVAQVLAVFMASRYVGAFVGATAAKLAATQQSIAYQAALARMAGASVTAATASTALAGAVRGASGAMALLGGPAGAAILAGGAIYYFREELGLVEPKVQTARDRVDELTGSLDLNSEAALKNARAMLEAEEQLNRFNAATLAVQVAQQRQRVFDEQEQWDAVGGQEAFGMGPRSESQERLHELEVALNQARNAGDSASTAIGNVNDKLDVLSEQTRQSTEDTEDNTDTTNENTKSTQDSSKAKKEYSTELDAMRKRLQPGYSDAQQFAKGMNTINIALASGKIGMQEYTRLMGLLQQEMQGTSDDADDLADANTDAADTMGREWERFGNSVDDTFKDAFKGAFDSFDDFADQLKGAFENLLAELAYAAVKNEIKIQLGMGTSGPMSGGISDVGNLFSGGGNGGILDSIGGLFGGGSSSAAAGGLYSNVATGAATGGLYSSAATGAVQGGLYGNVATGGLASSGGLMSGMGSMAAAAGPAVAAYAAMEAASWLDEKFASDAKYRIDAGGLGVGINMISKGLFGGSWEPTGKGGVELGVGDEGVTGRNFAEERKSGGLFSGSSYKDVFSDLDSDFENQLADTYAAQLSAAEGAFMALGEETAGTVLDSFTAGLYRIRTDNKSEEEVSQAINTWLSSTLNSAVSGVDGAGAAAQFARSGEGISDTVIRLGTALQAFNETVVRVKDNALDASYASGDAADSIIQMAGGVESLSTLTDYYFNNILSSEERIQKASDSGARALGRFSAATGEVVNTSDELKALVDGLDLTTDAGQRLYAEALKVAPALQDVEKGLESVSAQFQSSIDSMNAAVSSAEGEVQRLYDAFMDQSFSQQTALLELAGDEQAALNLARERELESIDPLLRETQQFIWQLEDEAQAKQEATKAGQDYAREINRVQSQLASTFEGISQWVDQQNATTGTPSTNLAAAGDQFARQLTLAENGDRNALQGITQYADQYLSAGQDMFASGSGFQRIQEDVLSALQELPDQLTAEEFLAQEVRDALREATQGISTNLGDVLRSDNPSRIAQALAQDFDALAGGIDGVLTREQLGVVMQGKATDAQLNAMIHSMDLNSDGVINKLESVVIESMPRDVYLGNILDRELTRLGQKTLSYSEIRNALSPIATDAEIDRLIDGVFKTSGWERNQIKWTRDKLNWTNKKLDGLATGIKNSLAPLFTSIDNNLDNVIDYNEFSKSFQGMATDDELKKIFNAIDVNGDGTISKLESLNASSDGTEDNTKSLEERAYDQLRELGGLVSEMSSTTDQFVTLNTTMMSLKDSINALGVAQEEQARIEKARQTAELKEQGKIAAQRFAQAKSTNISERERAENIRANIAGLKQDRSDLFSAYDAFNQQKEVEPNWRDTIGRIAGKSDNQIEAIIESRRSIGWDRSANTMQAWMERRTAQREFGSVEQIDSRLSNFKMSLENALSSISSSGAARSSTYRELEESRDQYKQFTGDPAPFATGGAFTNSIVKRPTDFSMGQMGEAGPEAIMPLSNIGGSLGVRFDQGSMPNLLGAGDVLDVMRDLVNENRMLNQRLARIESHAGASVQVQQAGFTRQINEQRRGNDHLDDMARAARLESSR